MKKLEISVGHNCNASCIFCYSSHTKDKNKMSTEKIKLILERYAEKGYKDVAFTGGEPTIRKDIFILISYAKQLGYNYVTLKTNMFMLYYPSFVKKLEKCGLDNISFSIFGFGDKSYSKITGVSKGFSYLLQALENLKKSKISLTVNILISAYSFENLSEIINLLLDYKIDSFYFLYISTNELGSQYSHLLIPFFSF